MSLPIGETPILTGKDAKNFLLDMVKTDEEKISNEELLRMKDNYDKIMRKVPAERWDRVTGYFQKVDGFNPGKKEEQRQRKRYRIPEDVK